MVLFTGVGLYYYLGEGVEVVLQSGGKGVLLSGGEVLKLSGGGSVIRGRGERWYIRQGNTHAHSACNMVIHHHAQQSIR